jgi:hypothetical protein
MHRHVAVPLTVVLVALLANVAMNGSDRALMLGLPGIAVLAAFALPTLRRAASALIDWFSVFFFTLCALTIWIIYLSLHTGVPAKPAANVMRLAPGFVAHFSWPALIVAVIATLAWAWLVRWRTGRHRVALWKSLVLPAGGVALSWALLMTLWLPLLDYSRSYRPHVTSLLRHVMPGECLWAPDLPLSLVAALEYHGRRQVDRRNLAQDQAACPVLLRTARANVAADPPAGWREVVRVVQPTDRTQVTMIYRRTD